MAKKESFLVNRIKSIGFAINGVLLLLKTESSVQIQLVIALLVTLAGFYFEISITEWMLQTLAIGLVIAAEGINTAIEKLSDYINPKQDTKIGLIKDISAGAVFMAAIAALILGLIIYIPKLT